MCTCIVQYRYIFMYTYIYLVFLRPTHRGYQVDTRVKKSTATLGMLASNSCLPVWWRGVDHHQ